MTVKEIRRAVFKRQNRECLWCSKVLTWAQAHLHEIVLRGKGGKISLENSIILCYDCHFNNLGAHGNRRPKFLKKDLTSPAGFDTVDAMEEHNQAEPTARCAKCGDPIEEGQFCEPCGSGAKKLDVYA